MTCSSDDDAGPSVQDLADETSRFTSIISTVTERIDEDAASGAHVMDPRTRKLFTACAALYMSANEGQSLEVDKFTKSIFLTGEGSMSELLISEKAKDPTAEHIRDVSVILDTVSGLRSCDIEPGWTPHPDAQENYSLLQLSVMGYMTLSLVEDILHSLKRLNAAVAGMQGRLH